MTNQSYELRVLINGKPAQEFQHKDKSFIEGRVGTEYTLQIRNHTPSRVLAIPAVDGISVLDGKPATASSPGYIVNANDSIEIKGFRKDMATVGAFKFCQKSKSYCNEAGAPGNNGMIGVIIFNEKLKWTTFTNAGDDRINWYDYDKYLWVKPAPNYLYWLDRNQIPVITCCGETTSNHSLGNSAIYTSDTLKGSNNSNAVNYCSAVSESNEALGIGTTWGQEKHSEVVNSEFEYGAMAAELTIYYASMSGLRKMGVPLKKADKVVFPKAFSTFATPPKNWHS